MKLLSISLIALTVILASPVPGWADDDDESGPSSSRRSYYLTQGTYLGDEVHYRCARGFHFASIWEIHDTSNLKYDIRRGLTTEESDYGPPALTPGWVNTGGGQPNCENWTSSDNGENFPELGRLGTLGQVNPGELFHMPPQEGGDGWELHHHPCWVPIHVWCVSD